MRKVVMLLLLFTVNVSQADHVVWGPTGHRVVGEIASQYLSGKAKRKIARLLHGQDLAVVANHADEIKSDNRYREFGAWHYVNIAPGKQYGGRKSSEHGDLVSGIEQCIHVSRTNTAVRRKRFFT